MRRRELVLTAGILTVTLLASGCGSASKTAETTQTETTQETEAEAQTIEGEVTAVSDSGITVKTEAGDEQEIEVTDDTEITRNGFGGGAPDGNGQGGPGGNGQSSDSDSNQPPEMPSGNGENGQSSDSDNNQPPEKPSGDSENGQSSDSDSNQPPEMPSGDSGNGQSSDSDNNQPPEMPSGNSENGQSSDSDSNQPPEMPSGNGGNGQSSDSDSNQPPEMPSGEAQTITLSDISVGETVTVTLNADGTAASIVVGSSMGAPGGNGQGGPGGSAQGVDSYDALTEYTTDTTSDGESFASTGTDENAVLISDGANVTMTNASISRQSSDSTGGDNSSFYGVGAAVLATDGTLDISDSTITTDADGGAGLFAYGSGVIYASDTTITTKQDTSGGVHVAGGGTLYGWNLTAETNGTSSAAVRSDRGGGTMVLDGGSYTSNGSDSPAVYCTADIAIHEAKLTSTGAEAVCIEGLNTLHLFDCDLSGSMPDDSRNDCTWNVILYQSMSGDSEVGNSTFEMDGGTLTASNGGMFYTTNTESTITLSDVDITYAEENDFFLKCTGNSNQRGWGSAGSNGADCVFTGISQEMEGDVIWDSISQLDFYMTDGSTLTGTVVQDETDAGNGGNGYCNVVIDKTSKWIVTGDSTLTSLSNAGTITDASGKTVTVKGTDGTVYVNGTSDYTITVDSYSTTADTSGAATTAAWSDYEVSR